MEGDAEFLPEVFGSLRDVISDKESLPGPFLNIPTNNTTLGGSDKMVISNGKNSVPKHSPSRDAVSPDNGRLSSLSSDVEAGDVASARLESSKIKQEDCSTSSTFLGEEASEPAYEVDNRDQSLSTIEATTKVVADEELLHPEPRSALLSKKEKALLKRSRTKKWKPGNIIRLLPSPVHIKTDPARGLDIDSALPPPPNIPERKLISLKSQLVCVGAVSIGEGQKVFYEDSTQQGWAPGRPFFLLIGAPETSEPAFSFVDITGGELEPLESPFGWRIGYETKEKRDVIVKEHLLRLRAEAKTLAESFEKEAKQYRIRRRLWELMVVDHEYFKRKNSELFRPGIERNTVFRAVWLGKNAIKKENGEHEDLRYGKWVLIRNSDGTADVKAVE
ncbi:hypothetical protein ACLMJK_008538 [Lecanora helva]